MKNVSIFCLTLDPDHEDLIKKLSLIPVGLGNKKFSYDCLSDKQGKNISQKNPYYGEYTFHYWLWKNYMDEIKTPWVGFCQYRKFFVKKKIDERNINFENLKNLLINEINFLPENFDCILGTKFSVQNYKLSKILKNHLFDFFINPNILFDKRKRNLKFHFDLFHGKGNLDKAIETLDIKNRHDFANYMNIETSFYPHNMFICKTKILNDYYNEIFPWLEKCEDIFPFDKLKGYGLQRIYGFLAERFLSYWFQKNHRIIEKPIIVKDISSYKYL